MNVLFIIFLFLTYKAGITLLLFFFFLFTFYWCKVIFFSLTFKIYYVNFFEFVLDVQELASAKCCSAISAGSVSKPQLIASLH